MNRLTLFFLLLLLASPLVAARTFTGSGNITIIEQTDTIMAVCTPNERYTMEPGETRLIRLYIRNDMEEKTVKRVDLEIPPVEGFTFSFAPVSLEDIGPEVDEVPSYKYFDINVTADEGLAYGNYKVFLQVGTDEYAVGSYGEDILVRVRKDQGKKAIAMVAISGLILLAIVARFFWILRVNRKAKSPAQRRRKKDTVSQYYYKSIQKK